MLNPKRKIIRESDRALYKELYLLTDDDDEEEKRALNGKSTTIRFNPPSVIKPIKMTSIINRSHLVVTKET